MKYVVDAREMKHYEETVIDTMGMPSLVLMERAAMAVAEEICHWAESEGLRAAEKRVLVVTGNGNNGADGLAVARILSQEGWQVTVYQTGPAGHSTREWERQYKIIGYYPVRMVSKWHKGGIYYNCGCPFRYRTVQTDTGRVCGYREGVEPQTGL